ncbi:MAG: response regulator [Thermodesulfobacteriota bacterium]
MAKIRVLLVDDHDVVRSGLKSLLGMDNELTIIGEAANGVEALAKVAELGPDVVVMDISMPVMDGMEAARRMRVRHPDCRILTLTVHEDKQYFFEMLAVGAKGYITKQAAAEDLVAAIKAVASGNVYLQPALARWLLEDYQRLNKGGSVNGEEPLPSADLDSLSKRELQILELVAEGLTTPEIAKKLDLSPKTVSRHRERIMNKLNLHSTTELVKFAIRTGLIGVH